jgi:PAS domain S-box-containing protein
MNLNPVINDQTACHLVQTAVDAVQADRDGFGEALDDIPAAIYVTASDGTLIYFNKACVEMAGRTPELGVDKWCVSWKIYTSDGQLLPHEQCPMALAIRDRKPVRGAEAVAERPDGTRVHFVPYPTPLFDADGNLAGAVNLLLDVSEQRKSGYLQDQADQCRRLAATVEDRVTAETLALMAAKYDEQSLKVAR